MKNLIIIFCFWTQSIYSQDTLSRTKINVANDYVYSIMILNNDGTISINKYSAFKKQITSSKLIDVKDLNLNYNDYSAFVDVHNNFVSDTSILFSKAENISIIQIPNTKRVQEKVDSVINNNIEGKTYFKFIVEKNGSVSNIVIQKASIHPYIDFVLMKILKALKFKPAILNGETISVYLNNCNYSPKLGKK